MYTDRDDVPLMDGVWISIGYIDGEADEDENMGCTVEKNISSLSNNIYGSVLLYGVVVAQRTRCTNVQIVNVHFVLRKARAL